MSGPDIGVITIWVIASYFGCVRIYVFNPHILIIWLVADLSEEIAAVQDLHYVSKWNFV